MPTNRTCIIVTIILVFPGLVLLIPYFVFTCGNIGNPTCYGKVHYLTLTNKTVTVLSPCDNNNNTCTEIEAQFGTRCTIVYDPEDESYMRVPELIVGRKYPILFDNKECTFMTVPIYSMVAFDRLIYMLIFFVLEFPGLCILYCLSRNVCEYREEIEMKSVEAGYAGGQNGSESFYERRMRTNVF